MVFQANSVRIYLPTKPTNSVFKVDVHGKIVDQSMDLMNSYFLDNTKFVANMHNTTILNLNRSNSPNKGDLF